MFVPLCRDVFVLIRVSNQRLEFTFIMYSAVSTVLALHFSIRSDPEMQCQHNWLALHFRITIGISRVLKCGHVVGTCAYVYVFMRVCLCMHKYAFVQIMCGRMYVHIYMCMYVCV